MRHPTVRAAWCLALAVMTGQLTAEAQQTATRRITVTVAREVEPFAGIVMHPVPPSTASQRVISWEMLVKTSKGTTKAELGHETGRFKKPILTVAADPDEKMQLVLILEIDLHQAPGPVRLSRTSTGHALPRKNGPVTQKPGWNIEHRGRIFSCLDEERMVSSRERSRATPRTRLAQLLAFMRAKFIYKGPG